MWSLHMAVWGMENCFTCYQLPFHGRASYVLLTYFAWTLTWNAIKNSQVYCFGGVWLHFWFFDVRLTSRSHANHYATLEDQKWGRISCEILLNVVFKNLFHVATTCRLCNILDSSYMGVWRVICFAFVIQRPILFLHVYLQQLYLVLATFRPSLWSRQSFGALRK